MAHPLVGRQRELAALRRVAGDPPALAVVVGDAGMGKTRLVEELLALPELRGHRVLRGSCPPSQPSIALHPLVDALRTMTSLPSPALLSPATAVLRPLLPGLRRELPADRLVATNGMADHLILRALLEVLAQLGPTICVLEDLHRCDPRTAELLRPLVSGLPPNIVLIAIHRLSGVPRTSPLRGIAAGGGGDVRVERVSVGPLGVEEVGELAVRVSQPHAVSAEFSQELWERTAGVPAAVLDTLALVAGDPICLRSGTQRARWMLAAAGVPPSVRDRTLATLERCGAQAQRVVRAAAVMGEPTDEATLATVSGLGPGALSPALCEVLEAGLLMETDRDRYGFPETLAAEAVHESIPRTERRTLHGQAARVLGSARPRSPDRLARHHAEAGPAALWARCADQAVDAARGASDQYRALSLLHVLIDQRSLPPERVSKLAVRLAGVALPDPQLRPVVIDLLRRLVADPPMTGLAGGEVRVCLATTLLDAGDARGWCDQLGLAVVDLESEPVPAAMAMAQLAVSLGEERQPGSEPVWLERASAIASRQRDRLLSTTVRLAGALRSVHTGQPDAWRALERLPWTSPATRARHQLLWAASHLAIACLNAGHYLRAQEALDDAARRAKQLGSLSLSDARQAVALELAWCRGEWSGLEERAHACLETEAGALGWSAYAHLVLGRLRLARGEVEAATTHLDEAHRRSVIAGVLPVIALAAGCRARSLLARGDAAEASLQALDGIERVARGGVWIWAAPAAPTAVEALIASGRLAEARGLAARFDAGVTGRDAPLALAANRQCAGLVLEADGDLPAAAAAFGEAARLFAALPHPHAAAVTTWRAGMSLMAGGDQAGSDPLLEALQLFESIGATADAERVRRALRRRSVDVPRRVRRGRRTFGSVLSPREEQVAALAAEGRTNEEVGSVLFISARTVEHHLSAAMRKLGIASRRDLPLPADAGGLSRAHPDR